MKYKNKMANKINCSNKEVSIEKIMLQNIHIHRFHQNFNIKQTLKLIKKFGRYFTVILARKSQKANPVNNFQGNNKISFKVNIYIFQLLLKNKDFIAFLTYL